MVYTTHNYIDGKRIPSSTVTVADITNPATSEVIGQLQLADDIVISKAIASAAEAFPGWAATPASQRAKILMTYRDIILKHIDELALVVTNEHGKTLTEAKQSIMRGIECLEFASGVPRLLQGQFSENVANAVDCYTLRQPLGVCLGISPFNFPVMIPIWCFAYAIACGNTCILKPSPHDPTASVMLAEWLCEAGCPPGVLNVLHGGKSVVDTLIASPHIQAVTAVGSTPVAKAIYHQAIQQGKRAQTFGGAKNHALVMPDAPIAHTANQLCQAAFGAAGERCMALSVAVVVGDDTANQLIAAMQAIMANMRLGPGIEPQTDICPLISAEHRQRVLDYVTIGIEEGAELIYDGRQTQASGSANGFYLGPSLFDHVKPHMRVYQDEIFGPILCIVRTADFASALTLINQCVYGNGTAIFTRSGDYARQFASRVQVGMVGINVPIPVPVAYHRFGGWKASHFGDMEMHAEQSIYFYTRGKSVTVTWPKEGE